MKPTTEKALTLISRPSGACPTSFLNEHVGSRYGARIQELRDAGYPVETRLGCDIAGHHHPNRTYSYHLAGQLEMAI